MILGRDILTSLVLNLIFSEHVIKTYYDPLTGSPAPMVDLGAYECKILNTGKLHLNSYYELLYRRNKLIVTIQYFC